MKKNTFGLIMAGGQGTRFWPYSTEEVPKQFLNIVGQQSLILQTYNRLKTFIRPDNIYIVADKKYLELTRKSIPGFRVSNFIAEPSPKNTAPCLILANIVLSRIDENANMLVVPADLARKIDENRGDMGQAEFIGYLIDSQLKQATKSNDGYVTEDALHEFESGIKDLLRSFLEFVVTYGLELGKYPDKSDLEELGKKLGWMHKVSSSAAEE